MSKFVMRGLLAVAILVAFQGSPTWAASITIQNSSFEDQSLSLGGWFEGFVSGWSKTGYHTGIFHPDTAQYPGGVPDGAHVAHSNGGTFLQTLSDTLTAGLTYNLSVDVGKRADSGYPGYEVQLLAGGNVLASTSAAAPANGAFTTASVSFTALTGNANLGQALGIRLVALPGLQTNFDNVRLSTTGAAPVVAQPEPGTIIGLSTLILVGSVFAWRRKKRTV